MNTDEYSACHPHEPAVAPVYDADGRCLICCVIVREERITALERRAAKWEQLHDTRTEQVKTLQAELEKRMAWRLTKACESQLKALRTILGWCDRSGEEPEGQCLHEIEQVCREHLSLELLRPSKEPITLEWLHSLKEPGWKSETRGISFANWTIHSVQGRPINSAERWPGYDAGPFVWTVAPTHGPNLMPLEKPGNSHYTILVLESRQDVILLLRLLRREG